MIISILNALSAIPAIAGIVESIVQSIVMWYVNRQQSATLSAIADAAAFAARADNDEARYEAAAKWKAALSRPRITA